MTGLFESPQPFKGQKFRDIKSQCKSSGKLFTDSQFLPNAASLYRAGFGNSGNIQWKRPNEIGADPKLFVEGTSSGDIHQGSLGNCWFVAATACLAVHNSLIKKIIPDADEQDWDPKHPENYQGIFHFRFWRHGVWIDVVIDDFLPTANGQLIYAHSNSKNEYWSALLEKAYAKVFGCYESLDGGGLEEALVDFTGGVAETIELSAGDLRTSEVQRDELYDVLNKAIHHKALMAAAIPAESSAEMEAKTSTGLVKGHAYSVIEIKRVALQGTGLFNSFNKQTIPMIRLRNPWGQQEWNGRFSDRSPEWEKISKSERVKIGLTFEDDGEFWMHFEDFCKYFLTVSVVRVVNKSIFTIAKTWDEAKLNSVWIPPLLAGGCINNKDTCLKNPQLAFSVTKREDDVLFSLEQKVTDRNKEKETIGFHVFKVEENRRTRMHELQSVHKSSKFRNSRSVFMRETLTKGRYVVVPCTFDPGRQLEFLLRVYTDQENHGKELIKDSPGKLGGFLGLGMSACVLGVRIRFVRAVGLQKQDKDAGGADPYILARCEKENVRIPTCYDTLNPEWDRSALFFKTHEQSPIEIEIWNKNPVRDTFMGKVNILAQEECESRAMEFPLQPRKPEEPQPPGRLTVVLTVRRNMDSL